MDENQKRTPGGRSENRRSNNRRREGGNAQAANRGSNAQPKFDPHFVSAPEATPLRPAKKKGAVEPAPIPTAANNARPERGERNEGRSRRGRGNDRAESRDNRESRESRSARPAQSEARAAQPQPGRRNGSIGGGQASAGQGAPRSSARAPRNDRAENRSRGRAAAAPLKNEDPGLVLISRRPPQQKFTSFEEYMNAHGGATAPIEDHSEET